MPVTCSSGCGNRAILKRPKTGNALCKECFFWAFEEEVHHTIVTSQLFQPGESVAIAASGGKDSTVLAYLMKLLNTRHNYGLKLMLLSIDEGITGYRDDSLETVKRNELQYGIPLTVLSYEQLYGWTMDRIVQQVGRRNNCTFCGVFRRQALDRGAALLGVDKMVTGHNADDIAETVIMNVLRGDVARLSRCCSVETGSEGSMPRSKPFKYTYEKEIVMYAYFKKLDYFSTECIYSPNAYRGHARAYIKELERIRPSAIIDIIHSGECLSVKDGVRMPTQSVCTRCGFVSSQAVCKACVLLEGLNKGRPRLGIGKSSKVTARMKINPDDLTGGRPDGVESIINSEDLVVEEPRGEDREVRTCEDLNVEELRGEDREVRTCFEDLTVEELTGEDREVRTCSEDMNVEELRGEDREVRTCFEDLTVEELTVEDPEVRTSAEDLTVEELRGEDREVRTCSEDLTVEELRGELRALSHVEVEALEHFMTGQQEVKQTNGEAHSIDPDLPALNNPLEFQSETVDHNNRNDSLINEAKSTSEQNCTTKLSPKRIFSSRKKLSRTIVSAASTDDTQALADAPANCSSLPMSIEDIGNNPEARMCENGGVCSGDCLKKGKKARKVVRMKENREVTRKTAGISKEDLEF